MSTTLKTSGLALQLIACVGVDSDGATIKEFVSTDVNANKTIDSGVTVAASTWKGVSRSYFSTLANGSFDFFGVRFASGHRPAVNFGQAGGVGFFMAAKGAGAGTAIKGIMSDAGNYGFNRDSSGSAMAVNIGGSTSGPATTNMPTDGTTKFSVGANFDTATGKAYFYGLESGSLAADGTSAAHVGFGSPATMYGVGGAPGSGNQPVSAHIVCLFNRALTLTEYQSLHTDWFGTLFDTTNNAPTAPGTVSNISATQSVAITPVDAHTVFSDPGDTLAYTASPAGTAWPTGLSINSSTGVITGTMPTIATTSGCKIRATDSASQTVDSNAFSVTVASPAARTVSIILTSDGTTARASLTGLKWSWFDQATPDLFTTPTDKGSSGSTDVSGVLTLTLPSSALSIGGIGFLVVTNSDGTPGQSPSANAFAGPVAVS